MRHKFRLRWAALALCAALLCGLAAPPARAALTERTLQLEQARYMALGVSSDIRKQNNQIILKRMKYVESVEGIRAKIKNLRSFRWTPLLNFKFPQALDLTNEYDLNIKPLTLQAEIDTLVHNLEDTRYETIHKVNQAYYDVYLLQESSAFTQERLDSAEGQLQRNRAGLAAGKATQTDVDRAQKNVETLTRELANQLREFENAKARLSELIGVDVTVGYRFENSFRMTAIPREKLEELVQYTLDHDQGFYEAKTEASVALMNLESYEELMRNQYDKKMSYIETYIDMAKQGMDVDYGTFQLKYREMLKALDKPWEGSIRILFYRFTKEWMKGEISGTRYIEDEIYAVYTASMEYGNARKNRDAMEKSLRRQVLDSYESVVAGWSSYETLQSLASQGRETLDRVLALNRLGKATYEETADAQTSWQDAQQDALEALKDYNDLLSEFERLTCGGVTKYLQGAGMDLNAGEAGDAYAVLDPINEPYYYIYTSVADMTFYFGVSIPDGFRPAIDSFEVWRGGTLIGGRTPVGQELHHLTLDYQDDRTLLVRLYNGGAYVDECEVDAAIPRDVLDIQGETPEEETARVVGTYSVTETMQGGVSISELTLRINAVERAAGYTLTYGEQEIYTTEVKPLTEPFSYLTLLITSLEDVTAGLYDSEGDFLMDIAFDTDTLELIAEAPGD